MPSTILLTFPLVFTIAYLGTPDWGAILSGYLGAILFAGSMLSISSAVSSMTESLLVAFVGSLLINSFLVLIGWEVFHEAIIPVLSVNLFRPFHR